MLKCEIIFRLEIWIKTEPLLLSKFAAAVWMAPNIEIAIGSSHSVGHFHWKSVDVKEKLKKTRRAAAIRTHLNVSLLYVFHWSLTAVFIQLTVFNYDSYAISTCIHKNSLSFRWTRWNCVVERATTLAEIPIYSVHRFAFYPLLMGVFFRCFDYDSIHRFSFVALLFSV